MPPPIGTVSEISSGLTRGSTSAFLAMFIVLPRPLRLPFWKA
jgi:hypothetical protein